MIQQVYYTSLVSDAVHKSTAQVDTGRPTSPPAEPPPLFTPNVFDCVGVSLQPRITDESDVRQCRVVRGTTMSPGNVECVAKERTALAPRPSGAPSRYGLEQPARWSLMFHSFGLVPKGFRVVDSRKGRPDYNSKRLSVLCAVTLSGTPTAPISSVRQSGDVRFGILTPLPLLTIARSRKMWFFTFLMTWPLWSLMASFEWYVTISSPVCSSSLTCRRVEALVGAPPTELYSYTDWLCRFPYAGIFCYDWDGEHQRFGYHPYAVRPLSQGEPSVTHASCVGPSSAPRVVSLQQRATSTFPYA